jgi:hypothetical protein
MQPDKPAGLSTSSISLLPNERGQEVSSPEHLIHDDLEVMSLIVVN